MPFIEVIARALILREDEVLLAHSKGEDNTFLPGGHVEFAEFTEEALKRELREELGVETEVLGFLGALEYRFIHRNEAHHEINLIFHVEIEGGASRRQEMESKEPKLEFLWTKIGEIERFNLLPWPLVELIPEWLRERKAFFKSALQRM